VGSRDEQHADGVHYRFAPFHRSFQHIAYGEITNWGAGLKAEREHELLAAWQA